MILRFLVLVALGLGVGGASAANSSLSASTAEVRREVIAVVDAQLTAFRKQDPKAAYGYASRALRAQKPLPVFAAIAQENYPEIWSNQRAEFGIVRDNGVTARVLVHVFASENDTSYDYTLVREGGVWRVHGILRHSSVREDKM